jgi:hypothetical protein
MISAVLLPLGGLAGGQLRSDSFHSLWDGILSADE